jgi:hypothetical protein
LEPEDRSRKTGVGSLQSSVHSRHSNTKTKIALKGRNIIASGTAPINGALPLVRIHTMLAVQICSNNETKTHMHRNHIGQLEIGKYSKVLQITKKRRIKINH